VVNVVGDHRRLQLPRQERDLAGEVLHGGGHQAIGLSAGYRQAQQAGETGSS